MKKSKFVPNKPLSPQENAPVFSDPFISFDKVRYYKITKKGEESLSGTSFRLNYPFKPKKVKPKPVRPITPSTIPLSEEVFKKSMHKSSWFNLLQSLIFLFITSIITIIVTLYIHPPSY